MLYATCDIVHLLRCLGQFHSLRHALFLLSLFFLFCLSPYLASITAMSSSRGPNVRSPKFLGAPHFSVTRFIHELVNYMDFRPFVAMRESGIALTIFDCNNITQFIAVCVLCQLWLHCGYWVYPCHLVTASWSICLSFAATRKFSTSLHCKGQIRSYSWRDILEISHSLVVLRCRFP